MLAKLRSWLDSWIQKFWEDLQPTPGRLGDSLRILLAVILTMILVLVWQLPFAYLALFIVFLVSRDSPSLSLRSSIFFLLTIVIAVVLELAVVILTDNDPMARVLSVAVVTFFAGLLVVATTVPGLGSALGFIFCILIAFWENPAPADLLVKRSLFLIASVSVSLSCSVVVEYLFGNRNPVENLQEQRRIRYEALEAMFRAYARGAGQKELSETYVRVARLAATGQSGMQAIYNAIVDRNLDPGMLPIGSRVRITMLAQLMDVSAAFGAQQLPTDDPEIRQRCATIADGCHVEIMMDAQSPPTLLQQRPHANLTLLDRVEETLYNILRMPLKTGASEDQTLVALPSNKVPILIPGGFKDKNNIAFGLKISLCATLCYIIYHAIDYPGISTSVITVLIVGLSTTGAMKQKGEFRLLGTVIGALIFGLGSIVYLFPHMDSITSLVVLIGFVSFTAAWCTGGRRFNYVGMQIAFSFYLVVLEDRAPTELAPARDRIVGILLALLVMWFVFDQMWPVRTVTAMRRALASVLHGEASFLRLVETTVPQDEIVRRADTLRDQIGKTIAGIRTMNDAVQYEYGIDRDQHIRAGDTILRAALSLVALFWNQLAVVHRKQDEDFIAQPGLIELRKKLAVEMDSMAEAVTEKKHVTPLRPSTLVDPGLLENPRYGEYANNVVTHFEELQLIISSLGVQV